MVKLVSKSPVDGIVPLEINGLSLTEIVPEQVTSVAPYAGQESAASEALTALIGAGIPALKKAQESSRHAPLGPILFGIFRSS